MDTASAFGLVCGNWKSLKSVPFEESKSTLYVKKGDLSKDKNYFKNNFDVGNDLGRHSFGAI